MGKILVIGVKEGKIKSEKFRYEYKNQIDISNPSLILIIFQDLENFFNAPIKKACELFLKDKRTKTFPI